MAQENRRQSGRLDYGGLKCALGTLINISAGGMVVTGKKPLKDRQEIDLGSPAHPIKVTVEYVWRKRRGLLSSIIGYKFIDPPDDLIGLLNGSQLSTTISRVI